MLMKFIEKLLKENPKEDVHLSYLSSDDSYSIEVVIKHTSIPANCVSFVLAFELYNPCIIFCNDKFYIYQDNKIAEVALEEDSELEIVPEDSEDDEIEIIL